MRPAIEVTQADWDATEKLWDDVEVCACDKCHVFTAEAFARHRIAAAQAERAAVVEWLRDAWRTEVGEIECLDIADAIEAGEHRA